MARPDLFRLDLDKEDSRPGPGNCEEVILRCAGRTRAWSARSATTEEPASLDGALACRGGAVNLAIPGLLLPDIVTGRDIAGLIHPRIETQEFIDGHSCYRIAGKERTESVTLWIDVHTFLLRRLLKVDTRILPIMTRMIIEAQEERIARARETNPGAVEAMRAEIEPWRDATGRVETTVYYHPEREVFEIAGSA
jgi:hypothetical protein